MQDETDLVQKEVGLEVDKELLEVPATFLSQPTLCYSGTEKSPNLGQWNLRGDKRGVVKFRHLGEIRNFHMLELPGSITDYTVETAHIAFIKHLRAHGFAIEKNCNQAATPFRIEETALDKGKGLPAKERDEVWYIRMFFNYVLLNGDLGVILIPEKNYDLYASAKRMADFSGRQMLFATGSKFKRGGQFDEQLMSNLALKANMRFGGENHHFDANVLNKVIGEADRKKTIVLGADIGKYSRTKRLL